MREPTHSAFCLYSGCCDERTHDTKDDPRCSVPPDRDVVWQVFVDDVLILCVSARTWFEARRLARLHNPHLPDYLLVRYAPPRVTGDM